MGQEVTSRRSLAAECARLRLLVMFVGVYLVSGGLAGFLTGRSNTALYCAVTSVLIFVFAWLHLRFGLSDGVLWALAVLGALHLVGGLVPVGTDEILYNVRLTVYPLQVDRLVHAYGTGVLTLVAWEVLRSTFGKGTTVLVMAAALAALGAAALGEVAEFATTRMAPTHVGGYINTGWDLTFNLLGCTIVAVWLHRRLAVGSA